MSNARPIADMITPTRVRSGALRGVASVVLVLIIGFFAASAFHHISQSAELLNSDLSKAAARIDAQKQLGMVDAVFDLVIHDQVKDWGIYHPLDLEALVRFELKVALGLGIVNGLLVLAMLFSRRRKPLVLFLGGMWVLALTAVLVLANPAFMGNAGGDLACNCTGLKILDTENIWLELTRNVVMTLAMLWMAFAWSTPATKGDAQDG